MALLATQEMPITGLEASYAAASAGGDTMVADGRTFLHVKNGAGAPITVTINATLATLNQPGFGDIPISAIAVVVTNAEDRFIPVPPASHASGGVATITYSSATSVTVAAIRPPRI